MAKTKEEIKHRARLSKPNATTKRASKAKSRLVVSPTRAVTRNAGTQDRARKGKTIVSLKPMQVMSPTGPNESAMGEKRHTRLDTHGGGALSPRSTERASGKRTRNGLKPGSEVSPAGTPKRKRGKEAIQPTTPMGTLPPLSPKRSAAVKPTSLSMKPKKLMSVGGSTDSAAQEHATVGVKPTESMRKSGGKKKARQVRADDHTLNASQWPDSQFPADIQVQAAVRPTNQYPAQIKPYYDLFRQLQQARTRIDHQMQALAKYDKDNPVIPHLMRMYDGGLAPYREAERAIKLLVREMPIWKSFGKPIRGLGESIFGQVLAEIGRDLSDYRNPSCLWTRMGVGLKHGHRQQRWSIDRKGFTKKENRQIAIDMGYNARRRSKLHILGECLIRANNEEYGKIYRDRKELELTKLPDKIDGKKNKSKKMHAHKRAMRYMEKRFLLDLWKAWSGHMTIDNQFTFAATPSTN